MQNKEYAEKIEFLGEIDELKQLLLVKGWDSHDCKAKLDDVREILGLEETRSTQDVRKTLPKYTYDEVRSRLDNITEQMFAYNQKTKYVENMQRNEEEDKKLLIESINDFDLILRDRAWTDHDFYKKLDDVREMLGLERTRSTKDVQKILPKYTYYRVLVRLQNISHQITEYHREKRINDDKLREKQDDLYKKNLKELHDELSMLKGRALMLQPMRFAESMLMIKEVRDNMVSQVITSDMFSELKEKLSGIDQEISKGIMSDIYDRIDYWKSSLSEMCQEVFQQSEDKLDEFRAAVEQSDTSEMITPEALFELKDKFSGIEQEISKGVMSNISFRIDYWQSSLSKMSREVFQQLEEKLDKFNEMVEQQTVVDITTLEVLKEKLSGIEQEISKGVMSDIYERVDHLQSLLSKMSGEVSQPLQEKLDEFMAEVEQSDTLDIMITLEVRKEKLSGIEQEISKGVMSDIYDRIDYWQSSLSKMSGEVSQPLQEKIDEFMAEVEQSDTSDMITSEALFELKEKFSGIEQETSGIIMSDIYGRADDLQSLLSEMLGSKPHPLKDKLDKLIEIAAHDAIVESYEHVSGIAQEVGNIIRRETDEEINRLQSSISKISGSESQPLQDKLDAVKEMVGDSDPSQMSQLRFLEVQPQVYDQLQDIDNEYVNQSIVNGIYEDINMLQGEIYKISGTASKHLQDRLDDFQIILHDNELFEQGEVNVERIGKFPRTVISKVQAELQYMKNDVVKEIDKERGRAFSQDIDMLQEKINKMSGVASQQLQGRLDEVKEIFCAKESSEYDTFKYEILAKKSGAHVISEGEKSYIILIIKKFTEEFNVSLRAKLCAIDKEAVQERDEEARAEQEAEREVSERAGSKKQYALAAVAAIVSGGGVWYGAEKLCQMSSLSSSVAASLVGVAVGFAAYKMCSKNDVEKDIGVELQDQSPKSNASSEQFGM